MHEIVRQTFGRLQSLNPEEEEKKLILNDSESSENELKMNVQPHSTSIPPTEQVVEDPLNPDQASQEPTEEKLVEEEIPLPALEPTSPSSEPRSYCT